jgi:hypothetical protein
MLFSSIITYIEEKLLAGSRICSEKLEKEEMTLPAQIQA